MIIIIIILLHHYHRPDSPLLAPPGEEKLNILEIVKPVETVEVVIDPDAAGEDGSLVEEGQLIAVERSALSDDTSEQVTRWAAALEGYRKEQVRLGIPYGELSHLVPPYRSWSPLLLQTSSSSSHRSAPPLTRSSYRLLRL